jgi:hypothetical protein
MVPPDMQCGAKPSFDAKRRQSGVERTYLHQMPSVRVVPGGDVRWPRSELPLICVVEDHLIERVNGGFGPSVTNAAVAENRHEGREAVIRCTMDEGRLSGQSCHPTKVSDVRFDPDCCL